MRTDELKELEKLGFELSDLLPRLEMIQHASEAVGSYGVLVVSVGFIAIYQAQRGR